MTQSANLKFNNRDESLTRYAFVCGYMEVFENEHGRVTLYMDSIYHVRMVPHQGKSEWDSFEINELTKARKLYRQWVRKLKRGEI